jgi:hypothetical protein
VADPPKSEQAGQEPDDDDALGGSRETDDQHGDDGSVDPEIRKLRAEAKRLRLERNDLRDKTKAYEDRDKTEQQRREEELASASTRAERAEHELLRHQVAAELGIPQHASRLHGETREALVEDAKKLAQEFGLRPGNGPEQRADFSSGARRPVQRPKTMNDLIAQAAGRR